MRQKSPKKPPALLPRRRPAVKPAAPRPETVLFAVVGASPAILTETVWALATGPDRIVPSRVVVMTTTTGRECLIRELLEARREFGGQSVWESLRNALKARGLKDADALRFGATGEDIRVFTKGTAQPADLADIRSPEDNRAMADSLLNHLRGFVSNSDCRVIASIAGGRKTMGALLYGCMTLIGREDDRVTHVLVNDPFDDPRLTPRFYFPSQPTAPLADSKGARHAPKDARIELADIPFVPLRNRFSELEEMPGNFSRLVAHYGREILRDAERPAALRFDHASSTLTVDGVAVKLQPRAMHLLAFLVDAQQRDDVSKSQKDAVGPLRLFVRGRPDLIDKGWIEQAKDDEIEESIRKALAVLRGRLENEGIRWNVTRRSLRLPPFRLVK